MSRDHLVVDPWIEEREAADSEGGRPRGAPFRGRTCGGTHARVSDGRGEERERDERARNPHDGDDGNGDQIGRRVRIRYAERVGEPTIKGSARKRRYRARVDWPRPIVPKRRYALDDDE